MATQVEQITVERILAKQVAQLPIALCGRLDRRMLTDPIVQRVVDPFLGRDALAGGKRAKFGHSAGSDQHAKRGLTGLSEVLSRFINLKRVRRHVHTQYLALREKVTYLFQDPLDGACVVGLNRPVSDLGQAKSHPRHPGSRRDKALRGLHKRHLDLHDLLN